MWIKQLFIYMERIGNAEEAIHYKQLFSNCDVIGLDYMLHSFHGKQRRISVTFNSIYRNTRLLK